MEGDGRGRGLCPQRRRGLEGEEGAGRWVSNLVYLGPFFSILFLLPFPSHTNPTQSTLMEKLVCLAKWGFNLS